MLLPIGEMREPVAILKPTTTRDASGGSETTYEQGEQLWVALRSPTTREAAQFGQINADVSHILFGHWHDLNSIPSDSRLKHLETDVEFEVVGLPMNDPKRAFTRLNIIEREHG